MRLFGVGVFGAFGEPDAAGGAGLVLLDFAAEGFDGSEAGVVVGAESLLEGLADFGHEVIERAGVVEGAVGPAGLVGVGQRWGAQVIYPEVEGVGDNEVLDSHCLQAREIYSSQPQYDIISVFL